MENADLDSSLAEIFGNQMTMDQSQEILNLQTNEEEAQESIPLTLLIKPFGFKPPPPKAISPRLLQAWNIKRGVTITPKKITEDILICMFRDERDMKHVEKGRAWSVQGAHMRLARWDKGLSLEEIKFDSITFWIQIRGIPPELLSKQNISRLAERAGKVLEIDWKDTPTLPKWYVTPRALVQVPVTRPLCPGRRINRKNGSPTWVFFIYEYLKTFCYDCEILGHDQTHCTSEITAPLNLYGPWLRFDNQTDLLPPQIETSETPTPPAHYPDQDPSSPTARKGAIPQEIEHHISFNQSGETDLHSRDSDNTSPFNASKEKNSAQTRQILTVADSKGKKADSSESSFIRRSCEEGTCFPGRKGIGKPSRTFIQTDSMFSGLMANQEEASPTGSPIQNPCQNRAQMFKAQLLSSGSPCQLQGPAPMRNNRGQLRAQNPAQPNSYQGPDQCMQSTHGEPIHSPGDPQQFTSPVFLKNKSVQIYQQRKRKNEMSLEDYLKLDTPYSRMLKKMAMTIGEEAYRDWQTQQPMESSEAHCYVEEMDEEDGTHDIQMAEEAGLIKPPSKP
ncbi:hypothetical protein CRG98_032997 [Punica granatum]|uniref:DUF4283 domain-containing protein n=1 Tax=Punica granatum TaxID=22663 RepID=A0A2I0IRN6_PUNGR|nr:hypothetical protein CRG98_032997 [Punica granatum]